MTRRGRFADFWFRSVSRAHRLLLRLSRWHVGAGIVGMPVVELRTTGRRSGRPRAVVLSTPLVDGERVVLVASKGGDDRHPEWYRNLVADPLVELTVHGSKRPMLAKTADAEERAELWPKVVAAYSGYAVYQHRTTREIPLVICEPRS
ncbi:nitroreductase family deazaflavin-dependent oxidoreductase [Agromyces sp. ISL-38]|uniref:nitroreductase/quinone reductase family protein n=1 Tax=Agromyces sp. ISL-38 TaxID=2819107 RepID=UPI001BE92E28|nr:nitroreductase/quinone reductase family protein [Agromyces sp. ISL-38]MBT2498348.1 nitroreductase family deazaflavin-dependent oxidoreductase [Agromyces sp. ISL-38]MBT2519018.1 nitroreductase family deazaflavin-dependent oxidoreductase [Streptomyces sp. ISL-90]